MMNPKNIKFVNQTPEERRLRVVEGGYKVSESQRQLYNSIMENLKPTETDEDGKMITGSARVPISLCMIDLRYQGMRTHKRLNRLRDNWDVRKLTPIVLVPHPEAACFAVVDGQGRTIVAPEKGITSLWAIILVKAPQTEPARLEFEAEYYMTQGDETEKLSQIERHPARVICHDTAAETLDRILREKGIEFVDKKGQRKENVLGSYTDTYSYAKAYGYDCLNFIFSIIEEAGWNTEKNGYSTGIVRGLKNVWVYHPQAREKTRQYLAKELRQYDPELFCSIAYERYQKRERRTAISLYLDDMVVYGLHLPEDGRR